VPALDRADEVIVDGFVVGLLRFDPHKLALEFSPKLEGARRIALAKGKKWVRVDGGAVEPILGGSNVLAPGILSIDPKIKANEDVHVLDPSGQVIAVGRSRMSADQITAERHGMAVKVRQSERPRSAQVLKGGQTWADAIKANCSVMSEREASARKFIKKVIGKYAGKPCAVAFSGGKDSLATLLLVLGVVGEPKVLFVDTGLEFPETVKHTKDITRRLGLELIIESAEDAFWRAFKYFGPPGRDYRWCCKTCKLGPTAKLIRERFPKGCITFLGQRKYESDQRYRQPRIWENPWVPGQLGVSPIKDWTAMHVWLYILSHEFEPNPLYRKGLERIGCWLCPASELWEFEFVKQHHPELWREWRETLREWAHEMGYSDAWLKHGLWRWQELPPGQLRLAERLAIRLEPMSRPTAEPMSYKLAAGFSPCKDGRTSIEGSFSRTLDAERVANVLLTLGEVKFSSKLGVAKLSMYNTEASVYRTGKFRVIAKDEKNVMQNVNWLVKAVIRAERCIGCGVCVSRCSEGAISLIDGRVHVAKTCTGCLTCYEYCPTLFFR
jgi:phosphoadenosine phosphosulfate reductase